MRDDEIARHSTSPHVRPPADLPDLHQGHQPGRIGTHSARQRLEIGAPRVSGPVRAVTTMSWLARSCAARWAWIATGELALTMAAERPDSRHAATRAVRALDQQLVGDAAGSQAG